MLWIAAADRFFGNGPWPTDHRVLFPGNKIPKMVVVKRVVGVLRQFQLDEMILIHKSDVVPIFDFIIYIEVKAELMLAFRSQILPDFGVASMYGKPNHDGDKRSHQ